MNPHIKLILRAGVSVIALAGTFAVAGTPSYKEASYKESTGGSGATIRDTPFRGAVTLRGGYDDNVTAASVDEVDSYFSTIYGELNADLGSPRTQFTLGIAGGATYYEGLESWDYTGTLRTEITHRATTRLTLSARIYGTYQVEPDFSLLLGHERRNGQYFFGNSQFAARYQWSQRFSTVSSYSLVGVFYDDEFISQASDRLEHYFSQEFRFLIRPTTTLTAEYRYGIYDYVDNDLNDGSSHYFLAGVDQAFSARLNASIRGGVEIRDTDGYGSDTAPYGEGTLSYLYGRFSNISWTSRYGFEQSVALDGTSRKTFRTGLRIKHGFTAKLSAFLAGFYHHNEYEGTVVLTEQLFDISTGVQFDVTRNFSLTAGYSYTHLDSQLAFGGYDRNRYNVGATFSF